MKVNFSKQNLSLAALLLATVLSTYFLLTQTIAPLRDLSDRTTSIFAKHIVVKHYAKNGQLDFTLRAPYANHIDYLDTTYYQHPKAVAMSDDGSVWHIQSDQATGIYGNKKLVLTRHVQLHQLPDKTHVSTRINTSIMTYYPDIRYAITHAPTTITRPDSITHGIGLAADLKQGIYRLLSHTQVRYHPVNKQAEHHEH